jgi:hypothetical protein
VSEAGSASGSRTYGTARITTISTAGASGQAHDIYLKQPIDLGPGGLGGGLAAVVGALGVYLFKDRQQAATTPDNSKGA